MTGKSAFKDMPAGRPSQQTADRARLLAALQDEARAEALKRVNFELAESKHTKLKIHAARAGLSVRDFLTAYIDSLPDV